MISLSGEGVSTVKVFRKRVGKTLRIEGISGLESSDSLYFTVALDNSVYNLKIGSKESHPQCIYVAIDNQPSNPKRIVKFSVTFMDRDDHPFFRDVGTLNPGSPLMIMSRSSLRDIPNGCLIIRFELSYTSWSAEDVQPKERDMQNNSDMSFSRIENLSRDFGKLFSQRTNADVVIRAGKAEIPAHSQILSARSEVFAAMFEHDMSEKRCRTIEISDIGALAMQYFLQFVYTGKLEEIKDMRQDILKQLYAAADKYAVIELKEMCSNFMLSNLKLDNLALCAELAFRHSDKRMQDVVMAFISRRTETLDSPQWREFEETNPDLAAEVLKTLCENTQTISKAEDPISELPENAYHYIRARRSVAAMRIPQF